MPALVIALDGRLLATVGCEGHDVIAINVAGTRVDQTLATLYATSGIYPLDGESTHLIWIDSLDLSPGQTLSVRLDEDAVTNGEGKTLEELYPGDEAEDADFGMEGTMFQKLRAMPLLRQGYRLRLRASHGVECDARTSPDEHGFGFNVLWNSSRPERATFSLHSYTVDDVENRKAGRDHARDQLRAGQSVSLTVDS